MGLTLSQYVNIMTFWEENKVGTEWLFSPLASHPSFLPPSLPPSLIPPLPSSLPSSLLPSCSCHFPASCGTPFEHAGLTRSCCFRSRGSQRRCGSWLLRTSTKLSSTYSVFPIWAHLMKHLMNHNKCVESMPSKTTYFSSLFVPSAV